MGRSTNNQSFQASQLIEQEIDHLWRWVWSPLGHIHTCVSWTFTLSVLLLVLAPPTCLADVCCARRGRYKKCPAFRAQTGGGASLAYLSHIGQPMHSIHRNAWKKKCKRNASGNTHSCYTKCELGLGRGLLQCNRNCIVGVYIVCFLWRSLLHITKGEEWEESWQRDFYICWVRDQPGQLRAIFIDCALLFLYGLIYIHPVISIV